MELQRQHSPYGTTILESRQVIEVPIIYMPTLVWGMLLEFSV
jgi:hypothetical protein